MAGQNSNLNLDNSERKYPGPGSFTWTPGTPITVNGATGYIPPDGGPNTNPNNGGNPNIDPTTGKLYPRSAP